MCGISGILSRDPNTVSAFLQRSTFLLKHRGPDQQSHWQESVVGLGHTRLSILDLSPAGSQPMHSSCGRYVLAFNGEIYNHQELRQRYLRDHVFRGHSDSETIIEGFARIGTDLFSAMKGMWALLIWDRVEQALYLSRDRFGQKPLYMRRRQGAWHFASEMKVLMGEGENQHADYTSLVEYLATSNYGHLGERTFFGDIVHFPAASWCRLTVDDQALNPVKFWQLPNIAEKDRIPVDQAALHKIRDLLIDSVLSQTMSDVPIGITLSGGIDSSVIAGILATHYQLPLQVFTATSPGHKWDEGNYVKAVMAHWNRKDWELNIADLSSFDFNKNLEQVLWHQEEPFGDPSILAHAELMRMAAEKGIKVILGGQGSDELFLGYDHALTSILIRQAARGEFSILRENIQGIGWSKTQLARAVLTGSFPGLEIKLRKSSRASRRKNLPAEWLSQVDDSILKFYRQDDVDSIRTESIYGIHLPHLLHYDDRNAMAFGVEGRTPFLDHELWEFVTTLQTNNFLKNGKRKYILREACQEFLPSQVLQRRDKIGFYTPLDSWLHKNIATVQHQIHNYLPSSVEPKIKHHLQDYKAKRHSTEGGQLLWRLYVTSLWHRQFLKDGFTAQREKKRPRFGVMTLLYYSEATIVEMIDNCAPFVDKVYVGFSELPWSEYNKNARTEFKGSASLDVLKNSRWHDKIEVIAGVWKSEDEERNEILNKARQDGMDYLIVQDADEFYHPEDYKKNLDGIAANPDYPVYRCPWTIFWKNVDNVILLRPDLHNKPTTVTTCPNFAVNCNMPDVHFEKTRLVNRMGEAFMLPGLCLHLAWVLDDEKVWMKVQTWGHSHQFDGKKWYKHKWLAWTPEARNIGNITRANYLRAVPFQGELPVQLKNMKPLHQEFVPLTFKETLECYAFDAGSVFLQTLRIIKARTLKMFRQP